MPRRPRMTDDQLNDWFMKQKNESENGCWNWTGNINAGYGKVSIKGKSILVHRYSLTLHLKREIPNETEVRHMCNNPICFNPEHLKEGTHADNMNDMVQSNRQAKGKYLSDRLIGIKHPKTNGEGNGRSKLTLEQISEIKKLSLTDTTISNIAKKYKISTTHVKRIKNGKTWKHLNNN